jgi:nucleotide-binding universal stress UspA family protein
MKRILAFIDFSDVTPALLNVTSDMARAFSGELLLMHVVESEADFIDSEAEEDVPLRDQDDLSPQAIVMRAHYREMEALSLMMKKEGVNAQTQIVETRSQDEGVVGTILKEMARISPDFIVIGSHGHGRIYKLLVGSMADAVIRKTRCPVVLVPSRKADDVIS